MMNPNLNALGLAAEYAIDQRVRISDFFLNEVAQRTLQHCAADVPYDFVYHMEGQNYVTDVAQFQAMSAEEQKHMQQTMLREAGEGTGFFYGGYVAERAVDSEVPGLKFLHDVYQNLNSEPVLELVRNITGLSDIKRADGQYTCYRPGQYLTRHLDNPQGEHRRLAYVISLSPDWHPDWGGLLQFYQNDGTPRDAWAPLFNSMALFDVRHVHSVTYITPFAKVPRLSLTGWFYAD